MTDRMMSGAIAVPPLAMRESLSFYRAVIYHELIPIATIKITER